MSDSGPDGSSSTARLDLILALIMALAAVATAWAGFQSTKWSGVQANSYAEAGASRTESNSQSTLAGQERIVDVLSFTQWLNALNEEIVAGASPRPEAVYRPTPGSISGFLFQRFRSEFRPAVDAWLATRPMVNPKAPPTPFVMPEYRVAADAEAARLAEHADRLGAQARSANQRSDNYVLTAVFFALVLFFAGVAGRTRRRQTQRLLIGFAAAALVLATAALATFPVEV